MIGMSELSPFFGNNALITQAQYEALMRLRDEDRLRIRSQAAGQGVLQGRGGGGVQKRQEQNADIAYDRKTSDDLVNIAIQNMTAEREQKNFDAQMAHNEKWNKLQLDSTIASQRESLKAQKELTLLQIEANRLQAEYQNANDARKAELRQAWEENQNAQAEKAGLINSAISSGGQVAGMAMYSKMAGKNAAQGITMQGADGKMYQQVLNPADGTTQWMKQESIPKTLPTSKMGLFGQGYSTPLAQGWQGSTSGYAGAGQIAGGATGLFSGGMAGQQIGKSVYAGDMNKRYVSRGVKVGALGGAAVGTYFGGAWGGLAGGALGGAIGGVGGRGWHEAEKLFKKQKWHV